YDQLNEDYQLFSQWLLDTLRADCPSLTPAILDVLVSCGDFCSLGAVIAERGQLDDTAQALLIEFVADGRISPSRQHDVREQGILNRALCCIVADRTAEAVSLIESVWTLVPTKPSLLIHCLELLSAAGEPIGDRLS